MQKISLILILSLMPFSLVAQEKKAKLSFEKIKSVSAVLSDRQIVDKNGNKFSLIYSKTLNWDLQTNKLSEKSELNDAVLHYCLAEQSTDELRAILDGAEVCEKGKVSAPDVMCAQTVKPPYFTISTENKDYKLGYASDACGNNSVNLCNEKQTAKLKDFIKEFNKTYKENPCK